MRESFSLADNILKTGVMSIADLIIRNGFMNVDFADVTTIMKESGLAHIAIGSGNGKDKAQEAAKQVISSPLLETSISGARRLLVNIVMSEDIVTSDMDELTQIITQAVDPDATIIFGADYSPDLTDTIDVTVIATDFADRKKDDALSSLNSEAMAKAGVKAPDNPNYYDDIFNIIKNK